MLRELWNEGVEGFREDHTQNAKEFTWGAIAMTLATEGELAILGLIGDSPVVEHITRGGGRLAATLMLGVAAREFVLARKAEV